MKKIAFLIITILDGYKVFKCAIDTRPSSILKINNEIYYLMKKYDEDKVSKKYIKYKQKYLNLIAFK